MEKLKKTLLNTEKRKDFISNISNDKLTVEDIKTIQTFVDINLERRKNISDSFELSYLIEYCHNEHLKLCEKLLSKKGSYLIKLTLLDFLLINFKSIPKDDFLRLNTLAMENSSNLLVIFQAKVNLTLLHPKAFSYFEESQNFPNSLFYYRLINSLSDSYELYKTFQPVIPTLKRNIKNSMEINIGQKTDLLGILEDVINKGL